MALSRSRLRAQVDHGAAAASARLTPGRWVLAGLYSSSQSAASVSRNVRSGANLSYTPAGAYEARHELVDDGANLFVRYAGPPVPGVKAGAQPKKTAARVRVGSRTDAAPDARLLLTSGPADPAWHAARRDGLGGSDLAALLGLTRSRGPRHVYEEKHGREGVVEETREMRMGVVFEPVIAQLFAEETGLVVEDAPGTLINRERPWMRGNVDRYVLGADGRVVAPLECKQRGAHQASHWEDGPPDAVAVQAHWYMAVGGWDHAYVAGLIGGNQLAQFRLERDQALIEDLIEHCGAWWQRHILDGFPPAADGLDATAKLLSRIWEAKPEQVAEVDARRASELRSLHRELTARSKEIEDQLTTVENEMRLLSADAEIAKSNGVDAWSWKQNGTFRGAAFKKDHPEIAAEFMRPAEVLDTKGLAAAHPALFRKYRARTLRVPPKGV
ncbi:YqaJ viral recombinase family protein [Streptomyces sp. G1]|uniref:YqaJ viral recombinase family nuclease n=1 Tax=Streptomyces sp. G1 TaxID=361572 RepID=UPI00202DF294|nr:YqaJ viral recombinase family protein [Streptomyces sp. G1]MCM1964911.1 YqaJ viral recombinase family protein [Streptomyces sp. G1]